MQSLSALIKKPKATGIILLISVAVFALAPYSLNIRLTLAVSVAALALWGASAMDTTAVSILYLGAATLLSLASPAVIFHFPFTENFYLIILSYLITEGVTHTGIASVFAKTIMARVATTPVRLILFSYLAGFLLIFFIPQPFPRVILLAAFYREFFKNQNLSEMGQEVLFFSIFTASTFTSMFFLSGDMLLNYVVVALSGASINWGQWALYMSVPTLVTCLLTFLLFLLVFRRPIGECRFVEREKTEKADPLTGPQRKMLLVSAVVFLGFATQSLHHLPAVAVMGVGVALLFVLGIVGPGAVKKVNWKLLIFFTAAMSVGGVLGDSGVADLMVEGLIPLLPTGGFTEKMVFLTILTLILNFLLGSAVTTSSVVIPTIAQFGILPPQSAVLTLFVYTVVSIQYILPFHHATVLVGSAEGLYRNSIIAKYGLVLTALTFCIVLWVCVPWWRFVGIL